MSVIKTGFGNVQCFACFRVGTVRALVNTAVDFRDSGVAKRPSASKIRLCSVNLANRVVQRKNKLGTTWWQENFPGFLLENSKNF
jgi:hypothetical protein